MHILCGAAEEDCDEFGKKEKEGSLVLVADSHSLNDALCITLDSIQLSS